MKNRLLFICFVRKVTSLDEFTDKHYKMTRSLFVYSIEIYEYTNRIF